MSIYQKEHKPKSGIVVYACNCSYFGGGGQKIMSLRPFQAKVVIICCLKK